MTGIAGYVVVCLRSRSCPATGNRTEDRADVAVLPGARQYVRAREHACRLRAQNTSPGAQFWVDVVYLDGCRMPW